MISVFDKKNSCCGCTACKHICPTDAIKMVPDNEGFLYPEIDQKLCIDCGLCIDTCAFQKGYDTSTNYKSPKVYALKHKSDLVRKNSSSGGAFTAISDYILSIDGIIYGSILDEGMKIYHKRVDTSEGRNKLRGSKYVQSEMRDIFYQVKRDLLKSKPVLFVGAPCQVAGIKRFLIKAKINLEKLLLVDFVCYGTPSSLIFKDFISYLEKKNKSKVKEYYFRSKVNGWGHTEEVFFESGKSDSTSILTQLHKRLFYSNLCIRPSCHQCRYTNTNRPSDITIADFWGIENYFPEFKDSLGVSAVIINTEKGSNVYSYIADSTESILSNIADCANKQRNLHKPSPINPRRDEFWSDYGKYGFEHVVKKYAGYSYRARVRQHIKRILDKIGVLESIRGIIKKTSH